jgi:hypothetical protein
MKNLTLLAIVPLFLAAASPEEPTPIEVDAARAEVRLPCRFVNPQRQIEVFACHRDGPAYETVVVFDATGQQLFEALRAIGCRPADYWNATSPGDFLRNQGDRVLVLVRWTRAGKERELPAEALLVDGALDYPSFVRGFSFGAREPGPAPPASDPGSAIDPGDAGAPAIPPRVEITLGATQRRGAIFSLLSHPTNLREYAAAAGDIPSRALLTWSFEPVVNVKELGDLRQLVEAQPPATLIFRRISSEVELVRFRRSLATRRGLGQRLALYERLEALAAQIDRLKARYEQVGRDIKTLLQTDPDALREDLRPEFAAQGQMLQRLGQWYSARLQELYFTMYAEEERFKLSELRGLADLDPKDLEVARTLIEDGLRFEPLLAGRERRVREVALRDLRAREEIRALEFERDQLIQRANLRDVNARLRLLDPKEVYMRQLLTEDQRKLETSVRRFGALRELVVCRLQELEARLEDGWEPVKKACAARRRAAKQLLQITEHEEKLVEILEEIRWAKSDVAESDDPRERQAAAEKTRELDRERKVLEATLGTARKEWEKLRAQATE